MTWAASTWPPTQSSTLVPSTLRCTTISSENVSWLEVSTCSTLVRIYKQPTSLRKPWESISHGSSQRTLASQLPTRGCGVDLIIRKQMEKKIVNPGSTHWAYCQRKRRNENNLYWYMKMITKYFLYNNIACFSSYNIIFCLLLFPLW